MQSVLLLGGAGYIGTHIAIELLAAGYHVVVIDNFINSFPQSIRRVEMLTGRNITLYEADVTDSNMLDNIFRETSDSTARAALTTRVTLAFVTTTCRKARTIPSSSAKS